MPKVAQHSLKFKQSTAPDVVANRVRIHAVGTEPDYSLLFDEVKPAPAAGADGFTLLSLSQLPKAAGATPPFDAAVTAVDAAGNESDFLDILNINFDLEPPAAPTDGSAV